MHKDGRSHSTSGIELVEVDREDTLASIGTTKVPSAQIKARYLEIRVGRRTLVSIVVYLLLLAG